ncbi:MAG TPA: hypothetical protein DF614_07030 [Methylococcaceae bacterium]|nr:hypothetical protein [Methylococcaceae bacterium]
MRLLKDFISTNKEEQRHVCLLEDDDSVRQSIELILLNLGYTVHTYSSAVDFLRNVPNVMPCVVVCDMNMPALSGVQVQEALASAQYTMPIIFISGASSVEQSIKAMKQGAIEFLIKPFSINELLEAISRGFALETKMLNNALKQQFIEEELNKLSPREREVFYLLVKGYSNTEILTTLAISLPTAKQYKAEVMRKLNFNSLSELIAFHQV